MGLEVSEAERMAMMSGEIPSQVFYNAFADPQTGDYNVAAISTFLSQVGSNPQYQAMWSYINQNAALDRLTAKYMGLIKAGSYANSLEVAQGVANSNESRSGRMVSIPYSTISDDDVTISDAEIKAYYEANKKNFAKLPHREISYVVFDVEATEADMAEIESKAKKMGEEFSAAQDARAFVRKNMGEITEGYVAASTLSEEEAVMAEGNQYGPLLKSNQWIMSRALEVKNAPDTLGLSHIVLNATDAKLADSLYTVVKGGADFAEVARKHSVYAQTAQLGGDMGVIPFSVLTVEIADQLAEAKKGDIIKMNMGNAIQIFKVTRADKPSKHLLIGSITMPIEPSSATRRNVHNIASTFTVDAKGESMKNFNDAATKAAVTPRYAIINQGDRTINGLEDSREVARWSYGAELGEISEIFNLGDAYVVAILTTIDDSKVSPVTDENVEFAITQALMREKKFEALKSKLAGASIEEVAKNAGVEVVPFENVHFSDFGVGSLTLEPAVVGNIASTKETGKLSAPVQGYASAVVFVVDNVAKTEAQNTEAEKVRQQAVIESVANQAAVMAIQKKAEVEDLRGKYF
jgi:peptidyl-prolyl cis-trans isomerase D